MRAHLLFLLVVRYTYIQTIGPHLDVCLSRLASWANRWKTSPSDYWPWREDLSTTRGETSSVCCAVSCLAVSCCRLLSLALCCFPLISRGGPPITARLDILSPPSLHGVQVISIVRGAFRSREFSIRLQCVRQTKRSARIYTRDPSRSTAVGSGCRADAFSFLVFSVQVDRCCDLFTAHQLLLSGTPNGRAAGM